MKHKTLSFLLTMLMSMAASMALAHDFVVDGIYYRIKSSTDLTVAVTYRGNNYDSHSYSGSVVIPSTVTYNGTTYSVTSIDWGTFYRCTGLTSVSIPESVTSIGRSAFYNCSSLSSVTIPEGVTWIGDDAFDGCTGLTSVNVKIPNYSGISTNSILHEHLPSSATWNYFINDNLVTELVIPESITSIGQYAFYNAKGITSVTIPNSVTTIGKSAFEGCTGLTSIIVPASVKTIENRAFKQCSNLSLIKLSSGLESIGDTNFESAMGVFHECANLKDIDIPNTVKCIGRGTFSGCTSLSSIIIPNSVTTIGSCAFDGCSGLTSISLSYGITTIADETFRYCRNLKSVTIPESVTTIGNSAFQGCTDLASITIGNSVTSIGYSAFNGCSGLTSVTIPDGVTSIGLNAFDGIKLYVNRGTSGLLAIWGAGYIPYEIGTEYELQPSNISILSTTQVTVKAKIENRYKEYTYSYKNDKIERDEFVVTGLLPQQNGNLDVEISNGVAKCFASTKYKTQDISPSINMVATASSVLMVGNYIKGDADVIRQGFYYINT